MLSHALSLRLDRPAPALPMALAFCLLSATAPCIASAAMPRAKGNSKVKPTTKTATKPVNTDTAKAPTPISLASGWNEFGGDWTRTATRATAPTGDGPKMIWSKPMPDMSEVSVRVRFPAEEGQAGLLFRVTEPGDGPNAHNGYYLGLDRKAQHAVFGRMSRNTAAWTSLVTRAMEVRSNAWYILRVVVRGSRIQAFAQRQDARTAQPPWPILDVADATFSSGSLGLRTFGGPAEFEALTLAAAKPLPKGKTYNNADGLIPDIADPQVLRWDGQFYAYGTGGNGIRVYRSTDLVHWSAPVGATDGYALHPKDSWGQKWWWAPEVYRHGDGFRMYYSVEERLGFADAKSPLGPFVQDPKQPRSSEHYEIDSHLFVDEDGKPYIYFVRFDRGNVIYAAELENDWKTIREGTAREVIRQSQPWETESVNEGPFVLKHKGTYYLMYSGNGYTNPMYGVGYATAQSPLGPFTKYAYNPVLQSNAYVQGVGHHAVVASPDGKELFAVYHAHKSPEDRWPRKMAIDRIRFAPNPAGGPDVLEVYGPTATPQPMPSGSAK